MKKVNLTESVLHSIVRKSVNRVLNEIQMINEYHHVYDNGLYAAAEEIADILCKKYVSNGGNDIQPFNYTLNTFDKPISLEIKSWKNSMTTYNSFFNAFDDYVSVYVGIGFISDAVKNGDIVTLKKTIFHELGHLVNFVKKGKLSKEELFEPANLQGETDINEKIFHSLYRFKKDEMNARCYETYMLLMNNKDATLEDIYNNDSSSIYIMEDFVNLLRYIQSKGENFDDRLIINELYRILFGKHRYDKYQIRCNSNLWRKDMKRLRSIPWNKRCNKVIGFFENRLKWFKTRINKIYYDNANNKNSKVSNLKKYYNLKDFEPTGIGIEEPTNPIKKMIYNSRIDNIAALNSAYNFNTQ